MTENIDWGKSWEHANAEANRLREENTSLRKWERRYKELQEVSTESLESLRSELATCRDTIKPYVEQCSKLADDKIKLQEERDEWKDSSLRANESLVQSLPHGLLARERDRADEWKRRAREMWKWMGRYALNNAVQDFFIRHTPEAAEWFEGEDAVEEMMQTPETDKWFEEKDV